MTLYIDLLIVGNDLALDPSRQPRLVDDRASIARTSRTWSAKAGCWSRWWPSVAG